MMLKIKKDANKKMTESSETSSSGWMSSTLVLAIIAILILISIFVYVYNSVSQLKASEAILLKEHNELKQLFLEQRTNNTALISEIQKLKKENEEIKNNQKQMIKTYKKRFADIEERFYDIDDLIETYSNNVGPDGKPNPIAIQNVKKRQPQQKVKVAPNRGNIRQRNNQRGRQTTFSTPSDDEDNDLSDSEIAMSDMRAQKGALLDL